MGLFDFVSTFKDGSAFVDNVSQHVDVMSSLSSAVASVGPAMPSFATAASGMAAMATAISAARASLISSLPFTLPAMKAVHVLEKKMEMDGGGMASTAGSASFSSYFATFDVIDTVTTQASSLLQSTVSAMSSVATGIPGVGGGSPGQVFGSLAAAFPSATIPDPEHPGQTIPNPAYTAFVNQNAGALNSLTGSAGSLATFAASGKSGIDGQMAIAKSKYADGMASLKAMSFARFCSAPQPTAVQEVIQRTVKATSIPSRPAFGVADAGSSRWMSAQSKPITLAYDGPSGKVDQKAAVPAPTAHTPTSCSQVQLGAIQAQCEAAGQAAIQAKGVRTTARDQLEPWLDANGFYALKNNRAASPEAEAQFKVVEAQLHAKPDYQSYSAAGDDYITKLKEYQRLVEIQTYMVTKGPWPGNPDGPW